MASAAVRFGRLIRPFSTRRLDTALYQVQATAGSIHAAKMRLLVEPPATPEQWRFELGELMAQLESLSEQCELAWRRLRVLDESADRDFRVAVDAMAAALRGLASNEAAESEPPALRAVA